MTVIASDRAALDKALAQPTFTLLILTGGPASVAQGIHDLAEEKITQPWRRTFIVRDRNLLTAAERSSWKLNADERYAAWECGSRALGDEGITSELLRLDGEPSILRIRRAFARGDQA